jgi:hypothetical protein
MTSIFRQLGGFTGDFPSCGFKERRQPLSVEAVTKDKKLLPWYGLVLASLGSGVGNGCLKARLFGGGMGPFPLIHSDLETRDIAIHSRYKRTKKSCERATRMSRATLYHKPHRDTLL